MLYTLFLDYSPAYPSTKNLAERNFFVEGYLRGSFNAVARDRGIAPSTVSRAIASLKEELGFPLFASTIRNIELTKAGQLYFLRSETCIYERNTS
jgi:hypothetical protein